LFLGLAITAVCEKIITNFSNISNHFMFSYGNQFEKIGGQTVTWLSSLCSGWMKTWLLLAVAIV